MDKLPVWLTEKDEYTPPHDKDGFISSSVKGLLSILSLLKKNGEAVKKEKMNTALRLFGVLLAVVLTSCATNFYFVYIMLAGSLVVLALSSGKIIRSVLSVVLPIELATVLILLPSIFVSGSHTVFSVTTRIFVSITIIMSFNLSVPWNSITASLKSFCCPNIIILTLDTALHYISILGRLAYDMLTALKVRSVGKNKSKSKSVSSISGNVFIRAKENADEMSKAMECRGFDGSFVRKSKSLTVYDYIYIAGLLLLCGTFVYFQVVMK